MEHGKHYFIEQTRDEKYVTKLDNETLSSRPYETQKEAVAYAKQQNPHDHPDVERVRNTSTGGRDQWRSAT